MQLGVVNFTPSVELVAPEQLVGADVEGICDLDQGVQVGHRLAGLPETVYGYGDKDSLSLNMTGVAFR